MAKDLFTEVTETLFKNKSMISEEYHPDVIVERDDSYLPQYLDRSHGQYRNRPRQFGRYHSLPIYTRYDVCLTGVTIDYSLTMTCTERSCYDGLSPFMSAVCYTGCLAWPSNRGEYKLFGAIGLLI